MEQNRQNEKKPGEMPPIEKTLVEGDIGALKGTLIPETAFNQLNNSSADKPEKIGSGTVVCLLGQGGMARIYKIWNDRLEIFRVVKILLPSINESCHQRFQTEARITAKLHHTNIVEIHAVDEWNGLPFIEMEFLDGADLKKQITNHGRFPVPVCIAIGIMICRALEYAHGQDFQLYGKKYHGIIHRDLKPENIMITRNGIVKLMDFGIARPTETSLHTVDGNITGTLPYLSPEQMSGDDIDARTDIYSFGAILYEMLTGEMLYPQQEITKLLQAKTIGEYKELGDFNIDIPKPLNKLIRRCLEMNLEKRYPDTGTLLTELEKIFFALNDTSPEKTIAAYISNPFQVNNPEPSEKSFLHYKKYLLPAAAGVAVLLLSAFVTLHLFKSPPSVAENDIAVETDKNNIVVEKIVPDADPEPFQISQPEPVVPATVVKDTMKTLTAPPQREPEKKQQPAIISAVGPQERMPTMTLKPQLPTVSTIQAALRRGDYERAARELTQIRIAGKSEIELAIRVLDAANNSLPPSKVMSLFQSISCEDGNYYLLKGRTALKAGACSDAISLFKKALATPSVSLSAGKLKQEGFYWLARAYTTVYEKQKDDASLNQAKSAWRMVKNFSGSSPDHPYVKEAEKRISGAW